MAATVVGQAWRERARAMAGGAAPGLALEPDLPGNRSITVQRLPRWDWAAWGVLAAFTAVCAVWLAAGWNALERSERGRLYDQPQLLAPVGGAVVSTVQPVLKWRNPAGAQQYELQVTPMTRRASTIHMYGGRISEYEPPAPPAWCCIEPDTLYFWRVRVSFAEEPVTPDDDAWGPWTESWFYVAAAPGDEMRPSEISLP